MKLWKIGLICSLAIIFATAAFAECTHQPKDGVYTTSNGTLLGGRVSEAWCSGLGAGRPGNTDNAMSWDGSSLGLQWQMWGMAIDAMGAIETGRYFDANGYGWIDYTTNYTGGQFWLSKNHLWGDGTTDYTGMVTYYNVGARVKYQGWQPVGVTSNVFLTGAFNDCTNCALEYVISNAILIWQTGYPTPMPADYPPFLCNATTGELYNACCMNASIYCTPISTESTTWGGIKALYR